MLDNVNDENEAKKTRTLLLKAAKMDTTKPGPFALLGMWYETQKDGSRAKGCFQKALALDPSHPVAGRGLQRQMTSLGEFQTFCDNAARRNSPVNGWAWRAMGEQKSREEGDDFTAVVCFQQALRCQDIQVPEHDILGAFYANPTATALSTANNNNMHCESSETWTELAACYRRMGKYSAALRAYEAAYSVSNGNLSPDALCAWAEVDLDLGLYEEAVEKCDMVLSLKNSPLHVQLMAAYIESEALLFLSRRDIQEGKFGSCLSHLRKGIAVLSAKETSADSSYCEMKLLGDLYSSGNSLPPYVFATSSHLEEEQQGGTTKHLSLEVENQLSFIMKGEQAYNVSLELVKNGVEDGEDDEDNQSLIASAATDLGTNLLSQARVISMALGEGSGGGTNTSLSDLTLQSSRLRDLITRSINAYTSAVDSSPHEAASAWCGLGCALIAVDPLLSQHAFSRAVQIEPSLADSWSNIAMLYANSDTEKCSEILDHLTQVEDGGLSWIGRGFLLEKTSRMWKDEDVAREGCLTKAADAYRSALQIMQHPAALLGLSLTCRRSDPGLNEADNLDYSSLADNASKFESRMSMILHQNMSGESNFGASFVSALTRIEDGLNHLNRCEDSECVESITNAREALCNTSMRSENEQGNMSKDEGSELATQCEVDLSVSKSLQVKKTAEFPYGLIKKVTDKASSASSSQCGDKTGTASKSCDGLDEARNTVYLNPESGEAWLMFAKKLAQEASSQPGDVATLSSAKTAAKKAYDLLHHRVVNATLVTPRRQASQGKSIEYSDKSVVSSLPSASLVSESMSLVALLEDAGALNHGDSFASTPQPTKRNCASLQESFLLDPVNPVAAALLDKVGCGN